MYDIIPLIQVDHEPRVDSRLIAEQLGVEHKATRQLIQQYQTDFEEFGLLPFEMEAVKEDGARGTKHEKFALLNEDQSYLLLTYAQNTETLELC
ncbi:MAG: Rha family transcriptional regulator [Gammaproteobacteria bacterium]|nr:Rha family transcriptional regulator [Gammaproteobacteria bacterium]